MEHCQHYVPLQGPTILWPLLVRAPGPKLEQPPAHVSSQPLTLLMLHIYILPHVPLNIPAYPFKGAMFSAPHPYEGDMEIICLNPGISPPDPMKFLDPHKPAEVRYCPYPATVYYRGLNKYQYHFDVHLTYCIL